MAKKANVSEAELILHLYDLRRETEMRKARHWWVADFWPNNSEDFLKVAFASGTAENNYLRQVGGYWGMAASFVLQGALSEELFLRPAVTGEMFLMYGKVQPFIKDLREKIGDPELFLDVEKVIMHTKWGRDRMKFIQKRLEVWRKRRENKA